MKELIKQLRDKAQENINKGESPLAANWGYEEGVLISNQQALDIVDALEVATYPPMVRAVLSILSDTSNKGGWAVVKGDYLYMATHRPNLLNDNWEFYGTYNGICNFYHKRLENAKNLLFQRTENGWKWVGNPENKNNKNI